jgi:spermidine/putrescine transport system substrate-binding protein
VGTTGIAYNQKFFPTPPDSWAALFEPAELEKVRGKASMLDDEREAIGAALIYSGRQINDSSPEALAEAQALLEAQKPFLAAYNSSDFSRKLASEEVIIAQTWNGGTAMAYAGLGDDFEGNPDIRFIIPKEGGTLWMDNFVIVSDSPNKYTAEVFLNFMMRPEVAARNADYVYYTTPNRAAEALVSDELKQIYEVGFGIREEDVPRLQRIQRSDESSVLFSDVWTRVKSS